ncbi:MAG TPA: DinB family protein [Vicinamibacterales bacterium]|nr:DinB family protein [Vicinamibacterales bacterium]
MQLISGLVVVLMATQPSAPAPDRSTTTGAAIGTYRTVKGYIQRSAEKMPADQFGFQPTPEVRSFGQVLAHIADGNYLLCAPALGEPSPNEAVMDKIEKDKLSREALLKALNESFAFCDKAYDKLTEATGNERVSFMKQERTRAGLLWFHAVHSFEHYGNLVTYMRLKGIVPPSSEPRPGSR